MAFQKVHAHTSPEKPSATNIFFNTCDLGIDSRYGSTEHTARHGKMNPKPRSGGVSQCRIENLPAYYLAAIEQLNCRSPFTQTFRCASNTSNGA
jgi:hypothetical protein